MSEFYVKTGDLKTVAADALLCELAIEREKKALGNLMCRFTTDDAGVLKALESLVECLNDQKNSMQTMRDVLTQCIDKYSTAESELISWDSVKKALDEAGVNDEGDTDKLADYLLDALQQILCGSWCDKCNLLGTSVSVLLGLVPVLGMILDIRDFTGDIKNLCTDDATAGEWICLGLDGLAIVLDFVDLGEVVTPFKQAVKNADSATDAMKLLKNSVVNHGDQYVDYVKNLSKQNGWADLWNGWKANGTTYIKQIFDFKNTVKTSNDFFDMLTKSGRTVNTIIQDKWGELQEQFSGYYTDQKCEFVAG